MTTVVMVVNKGTSPIEVVVFSLQNVADAMTYSTAPDTTFVASTVKFAGAKYVVPVGGFKEVTIWQGQSFEVNEIKS